MRRTFVGNCTTDINCACEHSGSQRMATLVLKSANHVALGLSVPPFIARMKLELVISKCQVYGPVGFVSVE